MRTCGRCGAKLSGLDPARLCPRCSLREGLTPDAGDTPAPPEAGQPPSSGSPHPRVHNFGDYELLREVACGGMGIVHKAHQVSLHRIVALKLILAGRLAGEAALKRFHTEAEAAAGLDHPNIVSSYEVGQHAGQHYYSMRFVEGASLAAEGQTPGLRSQKSAALLLAKAARVVPYAHQHGVLHRDLRPANILVDTHGGPHVTDFGLAKLLADDTEHTVSGVVMGSPHYLSPEQAGGMMGTLTAAMDIYSLGAVLYFLLTGRPPFEGASPLEMMSKVLGEELPPPSRLASRLQPASRRTTPQAAEAAARRPPSGETPHKVDRDLETICLKCLEKDPPGVTPRPKRWRTTWSGGRGVIPSAPAPARRGVARRSGCNANSPWRVGPPRRSW